jgi:hypothetical protein
MALMNPQNYLNMVAIALYAAMEVALHVARAGSRARINSFHEHDVDQEDQHEGESRVENKTR